MIGIPVLRNDCNGVVTGYFNRPWTQFQQGFGSPTLYWIGLDRLHQLTQGNCQVRFDIQSKADLTRYYAQYSSFSVGDSSTNYKLTIGGWTGDTSDDGMSESNGQQFTTNDADHDVNSAGNCAVGYGGGFWYGGGACSYALISVNVPYDFLWLNHGWMPLNAVEVYLLC